eukprot:TRINITY_DN29113_c0_g1_i1.p1 TRINITY_DN29113_c0_g1~~TRINITY_DN29113_c0_g1_i1.p1  ORF type:complete len:165 (-),score=40.39 TRINITY_DN29113_c0_g1_i1:89-583(-)
MQRGLVGSEMCIRDRYQRRVHGYEGRSKLVSEHPPGLADMKMGTKQTEKNVQEATEKMQDLGEYISILKDDVAGLDKAAKEEIAEIEMITPPAKTRMISSLRKFLTEQQEEYFKFHKDVCVLTKEKDDLSKGVAKCFERVSQLEESLGISHPQRIDLQLSLIHI